jgi:hypothetical protein
MYTRRQFGGAVLGLAALALLLGGTGRARADFIAYANDGGGNFYRLDVTTGGTTFIANDGLYAGLGWGPGGVLYGTNAANNLVTVNPLTGATTTVGNLGIVATVFAGLGNGALYAVDVNDSLYSVNPTTGQATLVGSTGLPTLTGSGAYANALAGDGTHLFYELNVPANTPASLYSLNLTNGHATLIGASGVQNIVGAGFVAGQLYGFESFPGRIDTINTSSGQAMQGPGTIGSIDGAADVNAPTAVPEPASLTLLATGALGLLGYGIRRRRQATA